ncbi:hypothetical protein [Paenibacillus sp. 1P03SA]|uniref:hypothetical protein n=1 Tax=Paenibacillus sp. 1P03SA TaxID=3132294 RepID=UPI00399F4D7E
MSIEMEPMELAVDEETYRIIQTLHGRQVAEKLLYEHGDIEKCCVEATSLKKSLPSSPAV